MNIQTLLSDLKKHNLTDADIGEAINAPQATITRLRNGVHKSTNYERWEKLKALHRHVTKNQ